MVAHEFVDSVCRGCDRSELVTTHFKMSCRESVGPGASTTEPARGEPDALEGMIKGEEPIPSSVTDAVPDLTTSRGGDNPYQWVALACAAQTREDWSEAIRGFRHVVRLRPKCVAAWKSWGTPTGGRIVPRAWIDWTTSAPIGDGRRPRIARWFDCGRVIRMGGSDSA